MGTRGVNKFTSICVHNIKMEYIIYLNPHNSYIINIGRVSGPPG